MPKGKEKETASEQEESTEEGSTSSDTTKETDRPIGVDPAGMGRPPKGQQWETEGDFVKIPKEAFQKMQSDFAQAQAEIAGIDDFKAEMRKELSDLKTINKRREAENNAIKLQAIKNDFVKPGSKYLINPEFLNTVDLPKMLILKDALVPAESPIDPMINLGLGSQDFSNRIDSLQAQAESEFTPWTRKNGGK